MLGSNTGYIRVIRMPTAEEDNPEVHLSLWLTSQQKLMKALKGRRLKKEEVLQKFVYYNNMAYLSYRFYNIFEYKESVIIVKIFITVLQAQPIPRIDFIDYYYLPIHDQYTGNVRCFEFSVDGK